jgi:hypothetical protein
VSEPNILNYQAKSETAKSVEDLIGKIDSARGQWDTYGAALTLSYKKAYEEHAKTLKKVEQSFREESSELFWYLLAALAAGMTGGVAGMLIAPILSKAGTYVARRMAAQTNRKFESATKAIWDKPVPVRDRLRAVDAYEKVKKSEKRVNQATKAGQTIIEEGTKEVGVKSVERLELEKFFAPAPPKPEGDIFKPPETDPHKFDLVKRIEIGICASILKENVRRFQLLIDKSYLEPKSAQEFHANNLAESFLNDQPTSEQIAAAASERAQKQAEVAMWIAWATAMKTEYWKIRLEGIQHIDRGTDYNDFRDVKKFDPVYDRLMHLGVGHLVDMTYTVSKDWGHLTKGLNGAVLSIPKLQQLGNKTENRFLKRVDNIVRQGKMTATDFELIAGTKLA